MKPEDEWTANDWKKELFLLATIRAGFRNNLVFTDLEGNVLMTEEDILRALMNGYNVKVDRSNEKQVTSFSEVAKELFSTVGIPTPYPMSKLN